MKEIRKIIEQQEIRQFFRKPGSLKDKKDKRDYKALEILAGVTVVRPSFEQGYSAIKKYWPDMPYKNQKATYSCVGQAWSYYKQILQAKDTGEKTELSAFSIYNPIAFPNKGSYVRDGGLRTVDYGVNKESTLPSPDNEEAMTAMFSFIDYVSEASYFKNRVVASVDTQDFEKIADMMFLNNGIVSGWGNHAVYFGDYGILNGKRFIKSPNSYGPGQDLYYFENMGQGGLYSIWTAIDILNMPIKGKLRLIRAKGEKVVWFLLNNRRYWVFNPVQMADGVAEGIWDGFQAVEELDPKEVYSYPKTTTSLSELWKLYISK